MDDRGRIREFISDNRLTYKWLIFQLHLRGIEVTKSEMSEMLSKTQPRVGEKVDKVLLTANMILDDYERYFINRFVE
jgi:hypothetical protein